MKRFPGGIFPRLIAIMPLLFPLYLAKGTWFGVPVTLPEIFVGFAALFFVIREKAWKPSWWIKNSYFGKYLPLFLFGLAAILGVLIVPGTGTFVDGTEFPALLRALGILKGWILFPMIYFVMARFYFRKKPGLINLSLKALLLSGVILSIVALQQVWSGNFITVDGRASGPFESANYLSLYLGPILIYGLFSFFKEKDKKSKIFLGISSLLCVFGLFFSASYAAWIAVFSTVLLGIFLLVPKKWKKKKWGILITLIVLAIVVVLSQLGTDKFTQFLEFSQRSSSSVRLQVYEIVLNLIKSNPIFGIGLGQFELQYQVNAVDILGHAPFEWVMLHPHNIFFAFWLNMGFLGLVSFVWLSVKALEWLFEKDNKGRQIAALMLVAILLHGIFDTPYFKNDLAFEFWLLMAILL